jgi:tRNA/tmRNA/rRNA uracil-C5-methylase (TrmA/RlmC/RlmD family)
VASWDQHGSAGLTKVTAAVLEAAQVPPAARVVDLGCGTGQVSVPLAMRGAEVLGVDVSPAMVRHMLSEVTALARKGPGGWWRIAKNAARYLLRLQERPVSMDTWIAMLTRSGFAGVTATAIVAEAGLVTGHRPESTEPA